MRHIVTAPDSILLRYFVAASPLLKLLFGSLDFGLSPWLSSSISSVLLIVKIVRIKPQIPIQNSFII
jgi:hypothetical protein